MIALLIDEIGNSISLDYYKQYSGRIFTTNKDINFFDKKILGNQVLLDQFLASQRIDGLLLLKEHEKIKLFDVSNFKTKSPLVCVSNKKWILKQKRLYTKRTNLFFDECQSILLVDEKTQLKQPFIDGNLISLIKVYQDKNYKQFVIDSEKWLFDNQNKIYEQIMVRYYAGMVYYFKLNNINKALEHLGIAILFCPQMPELWCVWGDILVDSKQYEKALEIFRNADHVKKHRNIFDNYPLWLDRNESYAESMIVKLKKIVQTIQIVTTV